MRNLILIALFVLSLKTNSACLDIRKYLYTIYEVEVNLGSYNTMEMRISIGDSLIKSYNVHDNSLYYINFISGYMYTVDMIYNDSIVCTKNIDVL